MCTNLLELSASHLSGSHANLNAQSSFSDLSARDLSVSHATPSELSINHVMHGSRDLSCNLPAKIAQIDRISTSSVQNSHFSDKNFLHG